MASYVVEFNELKAQYVNTMEDAGEHGDDADLGFLLSIQYKVEVNCNDWKGAIATLDKI